MESDKKVLVFFSIVIVLVIFAGLMYYFRSDHPTGLVSAEKTEGPLFQISVEVPEEYSEIPIGEKVLTYVEIENVGEGSRMDVILTYSIKDSDENEVVRQSETVAVETSNSFVRYFDLPSSSGTGRYQVEVILSYSADKEAKSEASFRVVE